MTMKCLFIIKCFLFVLIMPSTGMGQDFLNSSSTTYHLATGTEAEYAHNYLEIQSSFTVQGYESHKGEIMAGSNFLITIVKAPFFQLKKTHEKALRDILGKRYDEIVNRLQAGENFYFFDQGRVTRLILCVQNAKKLVDIFTILFKSPRSFAVGVLDTDHDGLPDYVENSAGLNKGKKDTDGDGLTDYEEYFKYRTNPQKKDSDGDGIPDGDPEERREYTYSIKALREIDPPFKSRVMNDIFQDVKVVKETPEKLIYEIIIYPNAKNVPIPKARVKKDYPEKIRKYERKTFFCNFSPRMQREVRELMGKWKVKDDYETLEYLAGYAQFMSKYYTKNVPVFFYIEVVDGKLNYVNKNKVDSCKNRFVATDEEVLSHMAYGDSMFKNRMHGSCSSVSVFMATILRAGGIPTRIVSATPLIDSSDNYQVELLKGLKHESLKTFLIKNAVKSKGQFSNHFFNEAYINGTWIRVDFNNVNIGPYTPWFGLLIKENVFSDFSEMNYAQTWGKRMVAQQVNPYKTLELSDQFPKYLPDFEPLW